MKTYYLYIITNKYDTVFYIGITNNLERRMYERCNGIFEGFSKKYRLHKLVYIEETNDIRCAIEREKELKKWKRGWKLELIRKVNPGMDDLGKW